MLSKTHYADIRALNLCASVIAEIGSPKGASVNVSFDCNDDCGMARLTAYTLDRRAARRSLIETVAIDQHPLEGPL